MVTANDKVFKYVTFFTTFIPPDREEWSFIRLRMTFCKKIFISHEHQHQTSSSKFSERTKKKFFVSPSNKEQVYFRGSTKDSSKGLLKTSVLPGKKSQRWT